MSQGLRVVLRDLCEVVQYGYTASASVESVGPRFLRITDIVPQLIDWESVPYCAIDPIQQEKFLLRHGDIVIARTGATVGYAKRLKNPPDAVFASYLVRLRLRADVDSAFVGAVVESSDYKRFIAANAGGAAQPNANAQVLSSFVFDLPPLPTQRRIASILSAYDDLIENNTRRIAILEEMARRLYEEWFVRFRFPGHEGVRMVESELGLVPEGWQPISLKDVCMPKIGIQTGPFGSQLHKADYSDEGVPVLMPKDLIGFRVNADTVARVPEAVAQTLGRHRMVPGDIVYGRRGDIGRRAFIMRHQSGWLCGTGCLRIRADASRINGWYLFNHLGQESVAGMIAGRAHGVTMPNLNARLLESIQVISPPRPLQDEFERATFPMAELRESLIAKNTNLRTTRDLLLPKLISGELDVSALPEPESVTA